MLAFPTCESGRALQPPDAVELLTRSTQALVAGPFAMDPIRDFLVPAGVDHVEAVFVNGVRQLEGRDYRVSGRRVSFARPLDRVRRLSLVQKLLIAFCANVDKEGDDVDAIVVTGTQRRSVPLQAAPPCTSALAG